MCHTIIRIIGNHLRGDTRWRGKDFTGAVFDGGNLSRAHFTGGTGVDRRGRFRKTRLSGSPPGLVEPRPDGAAREA
ncbi:pentapeptide repeat-containing protein [Nocardiopsis ganjiahuensis]|uniref:pentapeptide repeat-containing protein n=1 Tax=Nocardiopsis ganjiahuensis TaxID=239984 RepID=UPI001EF9E04B|nr:pentapeptide repeat-containing protein [Nocardiopsis ganjiahuensis]